MLAQQEHAHATALLSDRYYFGDAVEIDFIKSCQLNKSFELGHIGSVYDLFFCYRDGLGGHQDHIKAVEYLKIGVEHDVSAAIIQLAELHLYGAFDIAKDLNEGEILTEEIARENPEAIRLLATIGLEEPRDLAEFSWSLRNLRDRKI